MLVTTNTKRDAERLVRRDVEYSSAKAWTTEYLGWAALQRKQYFNSKKELVASINNVLDMKAKRTKGYQIWIADSN
tara:strand:+ start:725 stop:952 length:228 start_codon:yes stop_codon:yes gene_type:complete